MKRVQASAPGMSSESSPAETESQNNLFLLCCWSSSCWMGPWTPGLLFILPHQPQLIKELPWESLCSITSQLCLKQSACPEILYLKHFTEIYIAIYFQKAQYHWFGFLPWVLVKLWGRCGKNACLVHCLVSQQGIYLLMMTGLAGIRSGHMRLYPPSVKKLH